MGHEKLRKPEMRSKECISATLGEKGGVKPTLVHLAVL